MARIDATLAMTPAEREELRKALTVEGSEIAAPGAVTIGKIAVKFPGGPTIYLMTTTGDE